MYVCVCECVRVVAWKVHIFLAPHRFNVVNWTSLVLLFATCTPIMRFVQNNRCECWWIQMCASNVNVLLMMMKIRAAIGEWIWRMWSRTWQSWKARRRCAEDNRQSGTQYSFAPIFLTAQPIIDESVTYLRRIYGQRIFSSSPSPLNSASLNISLKCLTPPRNDIENP